MEHDVSLVNQGNAAQRIASLQEMMKALPFPVMGTDVNNHIHTTYSFSPYSPTAAAYKARMAGLCTAGIMDHDTLGGAREFIKACGLLGIGGTCGVECRVSFEGTKLADRRINNPDQKGVAYMLLHAVPHDKIEETDAFFAPLREKRNLRNRKMVAGFNEMAKETPFHLSFEKDVLPLSLYAEGGVVTERHIASAIAYALEAHAGRGAAFIRCIEESFHKRVGESYAKLFLQENNPYFHYDAIGFVKAELLPDFYVDAHEECASVQEVLALSERVGAISAYAYLGDINQSVTGDKRAQQFEDSYLDELFDVIAELGFRAVTYMPTRNTPAQIQRLREKIHEKNFFEISGEDINQPRQSFVCTAMQGKAFDALRDSAWAMVAHERRKEGLFSDAMCARYPDLQQRVSAFAQEGKSNARI